jgi:hypothetical protein
MKKESKILETKGVLSNFYHPTKLNKTNETTANTTEEIINYTTELDN